MTPDALRLDCAVPRGQERRLTQFATVGTSSFSPQTAKYDAHKFSNYIHVPCLVVPSLQ